MLKKIFFLTKQIKIRAVSFIRAEIKKTIKVDKKNGKHRNRECELLCR